mgnify:CR=1 FL=1
MNIKQRIRTINKKYEKEAEERRTLNVRKVRCQGCGAVIDPDAEDLPKVECVKTKRGSEWFFHTACRDQVWKRKIV